MGEIWRSVFATCLIRKSTSSELWTLFIRQVPPKWFARWMLAPAPTRALMMARWLQRNILIYSSYWTFQCTLCPVLASQCNTQTSQRWSQSLTQHWHQPRVCNNKCHIYWHEMMMMITWAGPWPRPVSRTLLRTIAGSHCAWPPPPPPGHQYFSGHYTLHSSAHLKLPLLLYGGPAPGDQVLHHLGWALSAGQEQRRAPIDLAADHVSPLWVVKLLNPPGQVTGQPWKWKYENIYFRISWFIPGGRIGQLALLDQGCEQMLLLVWPVYIAGNTHFVFVIFALFLTILTTCSLSYFSRHSRCCIPVAH